MKNLIYNLAIILLLSISGKGYGQCSVPTVERDALIALYNATDGANWNDNTNWNTSAPVCDWYGVTVMGDQFVLSLNLYDNNLSGSLPFEIGNLSNLTSLDLSGNLLFGDIPVELGNLSNLSGLYLNSNQLSGTIPLELGNLSLLADLHLYSNQLSGGIPVELGNLSNIGVLDLAGNLLSGSIPSTIGNLPLNHLHLNNNQLSGTIPSTFGNLTQLFRLYLSGNQLSGAIPSAIGSISTLNTFAFQNNAFVFCDFEAEHLTYLANLTNYTYSPQTKVDEIETVDIQEGNNQTLTTSLNCASNSYQWYKDGVAISGATNKDYVITGATSTDAGVYHVIATNSVISGLTLEREPITVTISIDPCPVPTVERDALIALYNATDGANWTDNTNWNTSAPVCDWYGVIVTNGNVISLALNDNQLSGTLPLEIGNLQNLNVLSLNSNQLSGTLPLEIGNLSNLIGLNLSNNELSGSIPVELGNLSSLTDLYLTGNQLSGTIPVELGNLSNLTQLYLSINQLSGSIPVELGNLSNLTHLGLSNNQLSGTIPSIIGNLSNLTQLYLSGNQLSGSIPVELGNLSNLTKLYLSDNQLSGSIPSTLGNLSNLIGLYLYNNQLSGAIPVELGNLSNLTSLYLYNNQLSGAIPVELGNLSNLTYLYLFNNLLSGAIPVELGNLSNLGVLDLANNLLSGAIPSAIGSISTLNTFAFQNNAFVFCDFEAEHPTYLANLTTYTYNPQAKVDEIETIDVQEGNNQTLTTSLNCASNSYQWYKDGVAISGATNKDYVITGATSTDVGVYHVIATNSVISGLTLEREPITITISIDPCPIPTVERDALIALYNATDGANWVNNTNWNTSAPVCDWYGVTVTDGNVISLALNDNQLSGTLPLEIGNLSNLTYLYISKNQLSGSIPVELGNLSNLSKLYLYNNELSGTIPLELGNLSNLSKLYLYNNQLSGTIPVELGNLSNIGDLDLSNNQLSGTIPVELGNLSNLANLSLSNNQLSGIIPVELGNLSNLAKLYLSNNQLSGIIPVELGNLSNLTYLYLYNNLLSGAIPVELGNLSSLTYLYLNSNQLFGIVPSSISTITTLNTFTFQNNAFVFCDFEAEHLTYLANLTNYTYSPQAKVDEIETVDIQEGNNQTLTTSLNCASNSYQWYKDGVAISGATNKDYVITGATSTDAGVYHVIATNSVISGLTLEREPITVTISIDPCPIPTVERDALIALYNATDGANWTDNTNWNTSAPVCDWYGVTVTNGNVTSIDLDDNNLLGTLPLELGNLSNLTYVNLSINQLSGTIPVELGNLSNLTHLYLSSNQLTGNIPVELGNLSNLIYLHLSKNLLSGSLPMELGNLSNLATLSLYINQLSGTIPAELGNLSSLTYLSLARNQLSGTIPVELGNLSNLTYLSLYNNQLLGIIPVELGNLLNINDLYLNFNQLSGTIPVELGNLSNLTKLFLSDNQLSGSIPSTLGNLSNLSNLSLSNNQLSGTISIELGNLSSLTRLSINSNQLSGIIPIELGNLSNLTHLYLSNNQLSGAIPAEFGNLSNLTYLSIENNQLSGIIPAAIGSISTLNTFTFQNNAFVFCDFEAEHPTHLSNLTTYTYSPQAKVDEIETIDVQEGNNQTLTTSLNCASNSYQWYKDGVAISGATNKDYVITGATSTDAGVYHVIATNSVISGLTLEREPITITISIDSCPIPTVERDALIALYNATDGANWVNNTNWNTSAPVCDWYGVTVTNGNVTSIDLDDNNLLGTLPLELGNLSNLTYVNLSINQLSGTIPVELGNLSNLTHLNLSENQLSGSLPDELGNLLNLNLLSSDLNQLSGIIPSTIGNLSNLTYLNLNNNQLSGSIPVELGNLSNLTQLYLSSNQLSGTIPVELGNLSNLTRLYLFSNKLSGSIPVELGNLSNLTYLILFHNELIGTIPVELGNLSNLTYLSLYNNQLSGSIPVELGNLSNLTHLYLHNNLLSGTIPVELGNLSSLTNLYLAVNQLSGSIPVELGNLSSLTYLSIENNQLSGIIPATISSISTLDRFTFQNNAFVFCDFEAEHPTYLANLTTYTYSPQAKVDEIETIDVQEGNNQTLTTSLNCASNSYQWYKDGVAISGATNKDYVISSATSTDAGVYHVIATNSVISGLTLEREPITITISIDSCPIPTVERDALIALYNATDGANWVNNTNWNTSAPVCDWYGVTVTNGNVTSIDLDDNNLLGTLPLELGNLSNLIYLYLYNNQLSGAIPSAIGSIPTLDTFAFQNNAFVFCDFEAEHLTYLTNLTNYTYSPQAKVDEIETVDISAGNSQTLTTSLNCASNSYQWYKNWVAISGATNKDYVISSATSTDAGVYHVIATNSVVSGLTLERESITVTVSSVNNNSCSVPTYERDALIALYIAAEGTNWDNSMNWDTSAPVCDWYGVTVTNGSVTSLDLNNNRLLGTLPLEIIDLPNLTHLLLFGNQLSGTIHVELSFLSDLTHLDLSGNDFSGSIPMELGTLQNLTFLSLVSNQLSGIIPTSLSNLSNLAQLLLSNNELSGTIPVELGNLSNLTYLYLSGNQLSGTIPVELGNLSNLATLDISNNQLSGTIPVELGNLSNLTQLFLSSNQLSGTIPAELGNLSNLTYLSIENNQLSGIIPATISSISTLDKFTFQNNAFVFCDFVTEHPTYLTNLTTYTYSPQAKVDEIETIDVQEGNNQTLTTSLNCASNSYQWYKDGVAISGATNKDYVISNATLTDAGVYHFLATNTIVTGLTLERNTITVNVILSPDHGNSFCTFELGRYPLVSDLLPGGSNILWYKQETGGAPLDPNDEIVEEAEYILEGATYWWDDITDSNTDRTSVSVFINQGTPDLEEYQTFSIGSNATIATLQEQNPNIQWFDSPFSQTPLASDTLLTSNVYYAEEQGVSICRLEVDIFIGTSPPRGSSVQYMCNNQTIGDLEIIVDEGSTPKWFLTETGGIEQPLSTSLIDGYSYYASQIDADGNESLERKRIVVRLIVVGEPFVPFNTQTFYNNEPHTVANLLAIGYNIKWYSTLFGGTPLDSTTELIDGTIYYAEQMLGGCFGNRVPVQVSILTEEIPTLFGCEKFKPQLGDRYVINGWVREQGVEIEDSTTKDFNNSEISDLFVDLLNHLKDKVIFQESIDAIYLPQSATENLNFDKLIPYVEGLIIDEKKLIVYDLTNIKDAYGKTYGFSFYLNKNKTHKFVYETPGTTVSSCNTCFAPQSIEVNYSLIQNQSDILEFTDANVVNGQLKVQQIFRGVSPSINNETVISTTSGISGTITINSYKEVPNYQPMDYVNGVVQLIYKDVDGAVMGSNTVTFVPKGQIIDGWQKIYGEFTIPTDAAKMIIALQNNAPSDINVFFDDIRVHPYDSNMKTFVYHPETQRLMSELDENNYATFYEYDAEGGLIRVKKETEKGIYTIQETRSGTTKTNN